MAPLRHSATVRIGDTIPDLELLTTQGDPVHLSDYRGEAMVLVFMRHLG